MERVTSLTIISTDATGKKDHGMDSEDEQICSDDPNTICTQNQINDLIIVSEVNKMLMAR